MEDDKAIPKPIHLGFQAGTEFLVSYIKNLENHEVNHVIFNLKYGSRPAEVVVEELGEMLVPHFS